MQPSYLSIGRIPLENNCSLAKAMFFIKSQYWPKLTLNFTSTLKATQKAELFTKTLGVIHSTALPRVSFLLSTGTTEVNLPGTKSSVYFILPPDMPLQVKPDERSWPLNDDYKQYNETSNIAQVTQQFSDKCVRIMLGWKYRTSHNVVYY